VSRHWTLEDYVAALLGAGLSIDALREIRLDGHRAGRAIRSSSTSGQVRS